MKSSFELPPTCLVVNHKFIDLNCVMRANYNPASTIKPDEDEYDWSVYLAGRPKTEIEYPPYLEIYMLGDRPSEPSVYLEGEQAEKVWSYLLAVKSPETIV